MPQHKVISLGWVSDELVGHIERLSVKLTVSLGTPVSMTRAIKAAVFIASSEDPSDTLGRVMSGEIPVKEIR